MALHNLSIVRYTRGRPELCALPDPDLAQRLRVSWLRLPNLIQLAAAALEFLQLTAAGAQPLLLYLPREPSGASLLSLYELALRFLPHWTMGLQSAAELGLAVGAMVLYSLLVGYWIAADRRDSPAFIFSFLPGGCYVTIVAHVLAAFLQQAEDGSRLLEPQVALLVLLPWLLYSNTATFVATYRWDEVAQMADVIFAPLFLCLERNVKGLLTIAVIYLHGYPLACGLTVLVLDALLLFWLLRRPFCSVRGFAELRATSILAAVWVDICSLLLVGVSTARQEDAAADVWMVLILGGWGLLLLLQVLRVYGSRLIPEGLRRSPR